jgi:hypothetical protein
MLCAASVMAVTSVNVVGYVNKTAYSGYTLLANPLNGANNQIGTIIPNPPNESQVIRWDQVTTSFKTPLKYSTDAAFWYNADTEQQSFDEIAPGEGFFFFNPAAETTLTFVGDVPQGNGLTVPVGANYNLIGSIVPQSASLVSMGFPSQNEMQYITWNPAGAPQGYNVALKYSSDAGFWYNADTEQPQDPIPAIGEGFFIFNPGAPVSWTRDFTVQ